MQQRQTGEAEQLKRYARLVWQKKGWVLGVWLAVSVLAGGIAYVLPNVYRSSTMILVERQKVPEAYVQSTVTDNMQDRLNTITQQLLSRTQIKEVIEQYHMVSEPRLGDRILERLGLANVPALQSIGRNLGLLTNPDSEFAAESAIERFKRRVNVKVVGKQAFSVSYDGYDPVMVMQVANAMAGMFITENLKVREAMAEGTTQFLDAQLVDARKTLEEQEASVQGFKTRNMGMLPEQLDTNLRALDRFQLELQHLDESLASEVQQRGFIQKQRLALDQQIAGLSDEARAMLQSQAPLARQLAEAEAHLAQLKTQYTEKYPEVTALESQIKAIRDKMAHESKDDKGDAPTVANSLAADLDNQLAQIDRDITTLKAKRTRLEGEFADYQKRVEITPRVEQELQKLQRDYAVQHQNYQALLEKQMNARLSESLERRQKGEQFRVLDPANLPTLPISPNRALIFMVGSLLGLSGAMGWIIARDSIRPRFHSEDDVSDVLGLQVLGVISRSEKVGHES